MSASEEGCRTEGSARALPAYPEQFTVSFLPFEQRKLRRDGLHMFNIGYCDPVLASLVSLGEAVRLRYDPRSLSKVYLLGPDGRYHPLSYADLGLPPITLWEQRAAMRALYDQGDNAPAQVAMFEAVLTRIFHE